MSGDDLPAHATIDDWIREEAVPFSPGSPPSLEDAVDRLAATARGAAVLGLGEALHGGSGTLELRNRLFARLVVAHGFTAIALESSYPRGRLVDDFVAGRVPGPYGALADDGFSHGFGRLEKNRELVEWMRSYNASRPRSAQLRFYGFDAPTEMTHTESPRALIAFVLDLLDAGAGRRARVDALLGDDAAWAEPAAMMDPSRSIGGSAAASALRLELGEIEAELLVRRPELVAAAGRDRYLEAVHHATLARRLLVYHAWVATPGGAGRVARLLGLRDGMMAGTLAHAAALEAARGGRLLAFGHASHLRRGKSVWRLGEMDLSWWTAGAHLDAVLGDAYAVIGAAVGVSAPNGIGPPGPGTLEARLVAAPGPGRFVPTHRGRGLPEGDLAAAAARPRDARNSSYFPLDPLNLADYDWLVALDEEGYDPGGPPLPG